MVDIVSSIFRADLLLFAVPESLEHYPEHVSHSETLAVVALVALVALVAVSGRITSTL